MFGPLIQSFSGLADWDVFLIGPDDANVADRDR